MIDTKLKDEFPFEPKYFKLSSGHSLAYIEQGEGEVILCLHGNPTWSFYYRNVVKEMSKSHRVLALDHIGCGFSDKPQKYPYTLEQHIKNSIEFLKGLGITKFALVLHDWGGAIGMGVATSGNFQVTKMAMLNTAAFTSSKIPFRINICKLPVIGSVMIRGLNAFAQSATFMAVEKALTKEVRDGYLLPYPTIKSRIAIDSFVKDIPMNKNHRSYQQLKTIEEKLPLVPSKIKFFWGGKDFCFNDYFLNRWKKIYPHASVQYYQDAGHYVLEDAKAFIIDDIANFMRYGT